MKYILFRECVWILFLRNYHLKMKTKIWNGYQKF